MFFPKNPQQNEMNRPKAGGLESLFSSHKEAPMSHRDVYPMGKIPQFDRNSANATRNTNSRLATSSYENTHHYAKAPKVDIARVMDVGSGEKKKNKTLPVTLPKKEKHEDAMASLKEELVEEHGKLPKAHASDEPPEIPDDDIKTKNGKKQPKKDPAWNFMMNEIKKNEAPPNMPQTDPAPTGKQPSAAQPAPLAQPNRPPPASPVESRAPPSGGTQQPKPADSGQQNENAATQQSNPSDSTTQNLRSNQPSNAPPLSDVRGIIKEFKSID